MPRRYSQRRFFTTAELQTMRDLAAAGRSQADAARALRRDPGSIAGAAIRYRIQFAASKGGTPVRADPDDVRRRRRENCRRYRLRKSGKLISDIKRFDDPRVMHQMQSD